MFAQEKRPLELAAERTQMPRRNHRTTRLQAYKGERSRRSFWHALAAGIRPLSEQVQK
jgi:hypothetical protein